MISIQIPTNKLKAALTHAAVADIRHYLNGVLLEGARNGDLHIVATDGRRALIGRCAGLAGDLRSVIIPTETIKLAIRGQSQIVLSEDSGKWALGAINFAPIDGKYPDWRRIIPRGAVVPDTSHWNFKHLADAEAALRIWQGSKKK